MFDKPNYVNNLYRIYIKKIICQIDFSLDYSTYFMQRVISLHLDILLDIYNIPSI